MKRRRMVRLPVIAVLLLGVVFGTQRADAHCDGMDGPVVKAAREALDFGDVSLVLVWVHKADEAAVRQAFAQTQAVRKLSSQAHEPADRYFFETVVRIHRAGEGEPYTGLKPAGRDLGLAIASADKAIETGSVDTLSKLISDAATKGDYSRGPGTEGLRRRRRRCWARVRKGVRRLYALCGARLRCHHHSWARTFSADWQRYVIGTPTLEVL